MRPDRVKCSVMFCAFLALIIARSCVQGADTMSVARLRQRVSSPRRDYSISDRTRRKADHCRAIVFELSRRDPKIGHPIHSTSVSAAFDFSFPSPTERLNYFLKRFRRVGQTSHILQHRFRARRVLRRVTHRRTLGKRL